MDTKKKFSLKDHLFNEEKVNLISNQIKNKFLGFRDEEFKREVLGRFPFLELKERILHISNCLKKYLFDDYLKSVNLLIDSLPEPLGDDKLDGDFGDFIYSTYAEFIKSFGCKQKYLYTSLNALKEITKRFSVEFALRDFIIKFPIETFNELLKWSEDENYHVRRLCSEGTRPNLPWAKKINSDIKTPLKLLDNLYFDKARFVTRSVANHLNDISKKEPSLVIDTLLKWKNSKNQTESEMNYIINHSLRTLVKDCNKEALNFIGLDTGVNFEVNYFNIAKDTLSIGDSLDFGFSIKSKKEGLFVIDYCIYFQNKKGGLNKKVFKLKKLVIKEGQILKINKSYKLKEGMTTRNLYTGLHKISININGNIVLEKDFYLSK